MPGWVEIIASTAPFRVKDGVRRILKERVDRHMTRVKAELGPDMDAPAGPHNRWNGQRPLYEVILQKRCIRG
jgi:hypothetical protein